MLPFHLEASRYWTLRSWDRTQIPKPFATVGLAVGEPFEVARDLDDQRLEDARVSLETRLKNLEQHARDLVASPD